MMNFKSLLYAASKFDLERLSLRTLITETEQDRKLFWQASLLGVIAYGIFITHHLLHNHAPRFPWVSKTDQLFAGRWFNQFVVQANYLADIPVLGPLLGVFLLVASGIVVLKVWRLNLTKIEQFVALGMLTTFPMCLTYFYYTYQTPLFCISLLFAATAIYITSRWGIWRIAVGGGVTMLALASYQPSISFAAAFAVSAFIARLTRDERADLFDAFKVFAGQTVSVGLGAILYKISLEVQNIGNSHATKTVALEDMPARLLEVAGRSYDHLFVTQPDLLGTVKFALVVLLVLAAIASLFKMRGRWLALGLVLASWPALVLATKAMFLLSSDNSFYQYRYNMGLSVLHAFSFAVLVHCLGMKTLRSIALALGAFVLLRFVQADLVRQEVLYRGEQHDLALANRILTRIEQLPDLDTSKTYDLVRIGKYSDFRKRSLARDGQKVGAPGDSHMDHGEISDRWTDEDVFVLLGSRITFKFRGFDPDFITKADFARRELLPGRKPWPHASSVFIHEDRIYVYMK